MRVVRIECGANMFRMCIKNVAGVSPNNNVFGCVVIRRTAHAATAALRRSPAAMAPHLVFFVVSFFQKILLCMMSALLCSPQLNSSTGALCCQGDHCYS